MPAIIANHPMALNPYLNYAVSDRKEKNVTSGRLVRGLTPTLVIRSSIPKETVTMVLLDWV
jgi:hypothetical protein